MVEMVKDFIIDVTNEDGEVTRLGTNIGLLISPTDSNGKPPNQTIDKIFS